MLTRYELSISFRPGKDKNEIKTIHAQSLIHLASQLMVVLVQFAEKEAQIVERERSTPDDIPF